MTNQTSKTKDGQPIGVTYYTAIFWNGMRTDGCEHCAAIENDKTRYQNSFRQYIKQCVKRGKCLGHCHTNRQRKIDAIVAMAQIVIEKHDFVTKKNMRRKFDEHRSRTLIGYGMAPCFICGEQAHHRHHLIQLQHGGRNTWKNQVALCRTCHRRVHTLAAKTA